MPEPSRGEVWLVDLNPTRGHEQAGVRPGLVVSVDLFNHGPAGLVVLLPLTGVAKGIPLHVVVNPPEGGVKAKSFIKCEDVRSVANLLARHPLEDPPEQAPGPQFRPDPLPPGPLVAGEEARGEIQHR